MKGIVVDQFGGPEVLKYVDMPEPVAGPGEVLIEVKAIGVNPVETYFRAGMNPSIKPPFTPGTDAGGVIRKVGAGVTQLTEGMAVYTSGSRTGTYAEFAVVSARNAHLLHESFGFQQAAAVNVPYATAYRALFHRGNARSGETVLIHGATGGVGLATVQFARSAGLRVIATGGTAQGRELVSQHGAHHVLDHRAPGYLEEVKSLTTGIGVNLIIEMLANVNLGKDLPLLAAQGRVVVVGSRGSVEINPRDLMTRDADIRAMSLWNLNVMEHRSIHAAIEGAIHTGIIKPVIGKVFSLKEAGKAHLAVMEPGAFGKIVLEP
ncbi:MAG: NADPH:quinone reductase [Verrucomicrobiota bacterium]|nr:NADPH:quinone reductase [Verrucomicrobiota bacterium]